MKRRDYFHCGICGKKVGASPYRRLRGPDGVDHMWCALGISQADASDIAFELSSGNAKATVEERLAHRRDVKLSRARGNIL